MRAWVAIFAMALALSALSGCIGGHATGIPRGGNATAGGSGDAADGMDPDAPPWTIKEPGPSKDGTSKDPGSGDEDDSTGSRDPDSSDDPGEGNQTAGGGGGDDADNPLGDAGASGTGDVEGVVGGVQDTGDAVVGSTEDSSKDPVGDAVDAATGD